MMKSHQRFKEALTEAVLCGDGVTDRALRQAVEKAAASGRDQHTIDTLVLSPALQRYSRTATGSEAVIGSTSYTTPNTATAISRSPSTLSWI